MVDDDAAARPHAVGRKAPVPCWRAARAYRGGAGVPCAADRRRTSRAPAVRADLRVDDGANARAPRWRGSETSARCAFDPAGALVPAEVLLFNGGSLTGARTGEHVAGRFYSAAGDSCDRDLQ